MDHTKAMRTFVSIIDEGGFAARRVPWTSRRLLSHGSCQTWKRIWVRG